MSIWRDISNEIDPLDLESLRVLHEVVTSLGVGYLVVGAKALQILLGKYVRASTLRATFDVDFGIMVGSWDEFRQLADSLVSRGWTDHGQHRFRTPRGRSIDLVPFGPIESGEGSIVWPPDHTCEMEVTGFYEALETSVLVQIDTGTQVPIAGFAGMTILKIISWSSRAQDLRRKDAVDLLHLFKVAHDHFEDFLYQEQDMKTLSLFDGDGWRSSCYLLGKQVSSIVRPATREKLAGILETECSGNEVSRLVFEMDNPHPNGPEENLGYLQAFRHGFVSFILSVP